MDGFDLSAMVDFFKFCSLRDISSLRCSANLNIVLLDPQAARINLFNITEHLVAKAKDKARSKIPNWSYAPPEDRLAAIWGTYESYQAIALCVLVLRGALNIDGLRAELESRAGFDSVDYEHAINSVYWMVRSSEDVLVINNTVAPSVKV